MIYRKDIEGLRGVAVLLVLFYHFNKNFVISGYIGVDIFFLISGYVMKMVYFDKRKTLLSFIINFYSNRIKRIIPLSFFVLLFVLINIKHFSQHNSVDIQLDVKYAMLGIANIRFYNKKINYIYQSQPPSVILHYWSLSIEQQYYIIFPFLPQKIIFILFILLFSIIYSFIISYKMKELAYFMFNVRLWEFLCGTIVNCMEKYICINMNIFSIVGMLLFFFFSFTFKSSDIYPSIYPLIPFIMLSPVIFNKCFNNFSANYLLSTKIVCYIGLLSYSIYLWHYTLLALLNYDNIIKYIFHISAISVISYHFIENPLKSAKKHRLLIVFLSILEGCILWRLSERKINYNINTVPPLFKSSYYNVYSKCIKNIIKHCDIKIMRNQKWYLLIGDSHLIVWAPFLYQLAFINNSSLLFMWVGFNKRMKREYENIRKELRNIRLYSIDSIFLSNYYNRYNIDIELQYFILNATYNLKNITHNIFLIEDVPALKFNPHYYVKNRIDNYQLNIYSNKCLYKVFHVIKETIKYRYLSFIDVICPNNICKLLDSNILMYVDSNHLSLEIVNQYKNKLLSQIMKKTFESTKRYNTSSKKLFLLHFLNSTTRYC